MKLFGIGTSDNKASLGMLLLRLVAGFTMAFNHGLGKMENYSSAVDSFPDPFGVGSQFSLLLAIFAELFCGIFIAVGFATRYTVIPLIITMATAFFIIHGDDPFAKQEMSFIYLAMYLVIFIVGPGKYSVDKLISK